MARLQSAMEYLMTYGWAILIIAIVLGVLYYLGVFSGTGLVPAAQPGSCQVFRPNGAGTSYDAGLSGACNNELPEYVAQFNGQTSYINAGNSMNLGASNFTITAWTSATSPAAGGGTIIAKRDSISTSNPGFQLQYNSGSNKLAVYFSDGSATRISFTSTGAFADGTWHFIAVTFSRSGNIIIYNDAVANGIASIAAQPGSIVNTPNVLIGSQYSSGAAINFFGGSIADVQIYNYTLSQNEIQGLYYEGIGGAPVNPGAVLGWWPLNGNPNDYSGNMNNGVPRAVTYISPSAAGYTAV